MIARAVPSASLPMRNTTLLPPRSTPVASASTFGRPSNTNATTPSAAPTSSALQPSCSTRSSTWPRRLGAAIQPRRPSIIARRMSSLATRRVVERPRRCAAATSSALAAAIALQIASRFEVLRELLEEARDRVVARGAHARERAAWRRRRLRSRRGARPRGSAAPRRWSRPRPRHRRRGSDRRRRPARRPSGRRRTGAACRAAAR